MRVADLKGNYDAIISLGDLCLPSLQLEKNDLRTYAGVLDWMGSPNLSDVNRLLKNRFIGFMELPYMRIGGYADEGRLWVKDEVYNIVSNHDFYADQNTLTHLATYPEVREKFDRRIKRFFQQAATCRKILFIRTEGDLEEARELQGILSKLIKHDFRILLVRHSNVGGIIELDWPLKKVCAIELPNEEKWNGNDNYWQAILEGIELNG
ncbi:peptidase [Paenibacillus psychroresistens]|uniref:Peptidase n=1 Tax=Paenibacillus psychroresistens TaxID=1778678 RepID=A0A6B8RHS4_9BACL|nr:DUF1796 family putative cysteine peptidase [Paenibacillus psychroresistens]QGQ94908.1 peptidase [Paenibacillus psychroresistens]